MSILRNLFLALLFTFLLSAVHGQGDQRAYDLQNVVPPSPNASSLGKFANCPVNLYTGLVQISVPIYDLPGRSTSVPISLSYHAGGIKVGENASCVGLGWSLEAGGLITRTVRGLPDDQSGSGFLDVRAQYTNPNDLSSGTTTASQDSVLQQSVAAGTSDSEPDLFMFNAMGKSYKFYFSGNGTIVTQPYSNVKLQLNRSTDTWTVYMEDGTKLLFGGGTGFSEQSIGTAAESFTYTSSWYLKSITTPKGEIISFTYTASAGFNLDSYYYQADYEKDYVAADYTGTAPNFKSGTNKARNQNVQMLTIASIESDLCKVFFDTTGRLDLPGSKAISSIRIYSKLQAANTRRFNFYYEYSTAASGNTYTGGNTTSAYRLKLDSLEEIASDSSSRKCWRFAYNPRLLPSRKSLAQDHWGYFNGATANTTFLPAVIGFNPDSHTSGNRSPDSASMSAEMLTKISYPTGGYSQFNYEPHSYSASEEQFQSTSISQHISLTYNNTPYFSQTDTFVITKAQYFTLLTRGTFSSAYLADHGSSAVLATVSVKNSSGTEVVGASIHTSDASTDINTPSVLLTPGTYTIKTTSNAIVSDFSSTAISVDVQTSCTYQKSLGNKTVNHMTGGVRVKSVIDYDGIDTAKRIQRYYQYENAFVVAPFDTANDYLSSTIDNYYNCSDSFSIGLAYSVVWKTRNSSTKFGLGSTQGSTTGYGKVTEKLGPNAENGKNVYYYTTVDDENVASAKVFPYPAIYSLDYERGLLMQEDTYTAGNVLVGRTRNAYQYVQRGLQQYYKAAQSFNISGCFTYQHLNEWIGRVFYYDVTNQVKRTSSTQLSYNTATGDSLTATTWYYYDDTLNMQPVRIVTMNSRGDSVLSYSRTALEKSAINSSIPLSTVASVAVDTMLARNMVGIPLESEQYIKGTLTSKILTNYKLQPGGLVLPDSIKVQNAGNPIETRVVFAKYDNTGNLKEQQKYRDAKRSYLYAYSGTYPIIEAINADSASIAYTSFETTETGNWVITGGAQKTNAGITGSNSYTMASGGSIVKSGLSTSRTYLVSYWSMNGALTISGTIAVAGLVKRGWTYYQHTLPAASTSVTITGSAIIIDELRLYPTDAMVTTYTYKPLIGSSSVCDANNLITYYEYDGMGRLLRVRDIDSNIVKRYEYQYNGGAPVPNVVKTGSFTRNNCSCGYVGSTVTYTVPAASFYAYSQAVADTFAVRAVAAGGQAYANTNGTCSAIVCTGSSHKLLNCVCETGTYSLISSKNSGGTCTEKWGYVFSDASYVITDTVTYSGACL